MKALVTGACGFVGSYLIPDLVEQGYEVLGTTYKNEFSYPFDSVQLDIADSTSCDAVFSKFQPDVVYHLAGIAFVPQAQKDFRLAVSANVAGVYNVIEAAQRYNKDVQVLMASSGEVYGKVTPKDLPLTEQSPVRPGNAYSLTKQMAEQAVQFFMTKTALRGYIMRPFNHIGPGQGESFVTANFASQLAQVATGKRGSVIRVGNLEAERDFMDVRDAVRAYVSVIGTEPGTYNLSSGSSVSIQSILDTLIDISGVDVKIESDPERMRPSEVPKVQGSYAKAEASFGWKPQIDLHASLNDIYQYWYDFHSAD